MDEAPTPFLARGLTGTPPADGRATPSCAAAVDPGDVLHVHRPLEARGALGVTRIEERPQAFGRGERRGGVELRHAPAPEQVARQLEALASRRGGVIRREEIVQGLTKRLQIVRLREGVRDSARQQRRQGPREGPARGRP